MNHYLSRERYNLLWTQRLDPQIQMEAIAKINAEMDSDSDIEDDTDSDDYINPMDIDDPYRSTDMDTDSDWERMK